MTIQVPPETLKKIIIEDTIFRVKAETKTPRCLKCGQKRHVKKHYPMLLKENIKISVTVPTPTMETNEKETKTINEKWKVVKKKRIRRKNKLAPPKFHPNQLCHPLFPLIISLPHTTRKMKALTRKKPQMSPFQKKNKEKGILFYNTMNKEVINETNTWKYVTKI